MEIPRRVSKIRASKNTALVNEIVQSFDTGYSIDVSP